MNLFWFWKSWNEFYKQCGKIFHMPWVLGIHLFDCSFLSFSLQTFADFLFGFYTTDWPFPWRNGPARKPEFVGFWLCISWESCSFIYLERTLNRDENIFYLFSFILFFVNYVIVAFILVSQTVKLLDNFVGLIMTQVQ